MRHGGREEKTGEAVGLSLLVVSVEYGTQVWGRGRLEWDNNAAHNQSPVRRAKSRCVVCFYLVPPKPKDSILISSSHLTLDGRVSASCDASCVFPSSLHIDTLCGHQKTSLERAHAAKVGVSNFQKEAAN